MRFALSPEQRDLQRSVQALLADRFPLTRMRSAYDNPADTAYLDELWTQIAQQGGLAVLVPEVWGGLDLGMVEAGLVARCFGAGAIPGPFLPTMVAAEAIRLAGSDAQQKQWLGSVAEGRARLALAFRGRPDAPWDSSAVELTVSQGRLSGRAVNVEFADAADALVVAAREDGDVRLFLADPAEAGVHVEPLPSLDRTVRYGAIRCEGAAVELMPGGGPESLDQVLDRAAALYAHDLAGIAREALNRTVRYDLERVQYGKAIGSFQAVKHVLADLHVAVTMAEHATLFATYALDHAEPSIARLAVSVAKAKASDVARDATAAMIQLHGGIGFTWEHDTHIFFKRAKREEYAYGDATWHRERIAGLLLDAPRPTE